MVPQPLLLNRIVLDKTIFYFYLNLFFNIYFSLVGIWLDTKTELPRLLKLPTASVTGNTVECDLGLLSVIK
jgi:hypothetical protein